MRRIALVVGVGLGFVVAFASPALAKGAGLVMISGPGVSKPVEFGGAVTHHDIGAFWEFAQASGIFDGPNSLAPTEPLGPRYTLTVYVARSDRPVPIDPKTADRFTISMYPYAASGPWFYVPEGVKTHAFGVLTSGWTLGTREALRLMVAHGLPNKSPVAFSDTAPSSAPPAGVPVPAAAAAHTDESSSSSGVRTGVAVAGALALLVVVVVIAGRPRKVAP
jgi:hypothetical protein